MKLANCLPLWMELSLRPLRNGYVFTRVCALINDTQTLRRKPIKTAIKLADRKRSIFRPRSSNVFIIRKGVRALWVHDNCSLFIFISPKL